MLIREIIQRVQSQYSRGVESDDSRLSNRHIYSKLITARSFIISQKKTRSNTINLSNFSTLSCIKLIKVNKHECPCVPDYTCGIYRTEKPLPNFISFRDGLIIKSVTSIDNSVKFNETTVDKLLNSKGKKYNPTTTKYLYENNHMYFYGENIPNFIKIVACLEDPTKVLDFYCKNSKDNICTSYYDLDFKLDNALIDVVVSMALKELVEFFRTNKNDMQNDTQEFFSNKR